MSGIVHLVRLPWHGNARHRAVFAWLAAVIHTLAVGIEVHGESRFVFFGMMLFTALGVDAVVVRGVRAVAGRLRWSAAVRSALAAALVAILVAGVLASSQRAVRNARGREDGPEASALRESVRHLASFGGNCAVMSTQAPQLSWYTRCDGYSVHGDIRRELDDMRRGGRTGFLVTFERRRRELRRNQLAGILDQLDTPPLSILAEPRFPDGLARIYRLRTDVQRD